MTGGQCCHCGPTTVFGSLWILELCSMWRLTDKTDV